LSGTPSPKSRPGNSRFGTVRSLRSFVDVNITSCFLDWPVMMLREFLSRSSWQISRSVCQGGRALSLTL
jgi:hypothetical protein